MQARYGVRLLLIVGGGIIGFGGWLLGQPNVAVRADELPPRNTVAPLATATPRSTATPRERKRRARSTPVPRGQIVGTVIDQRTSAPAPGIKVRVGDRIVVTNPDGNYERVNLRSGSYKVALVLDPGQGMAAQAPVTVVLPAGERIVQHLFFRSP